MNNVAPQYFTMGENQNKISTTAMSQQQQQQQQQVHKIGQIMKSIQPKGPTNLSKQLQIIHRYISSISNQLLSSNQKISIVIATQGLPTNDNDETNYQITQEFISTLHSFNTLPVVMNIRLCTDDEKVFDYYNSLLDNDHMSHMLNIPFDVIDDYFGEALEVYLKNPWLTYALSLHRFREYGFYSKTMDLLDERLLSLDELYEFCYILFDVDNNMTFPHPKVHWEDFLNALSVFIKKENQQWNPVLRKFSPWVNVIQLKKIYEDNHEQVLKMQMKNQGDRQNNMHPPPPPQYQPQQPQQQYCQQQQPKAHPQTQGTQTPVIPTPTPPIDNESIKKTLLIAWALQGPDYQSLKILSELLGTLENALPPAFGVEEHAYFKKWKVLSSEALSTGGYAVVKRGKEI